VRSSKFYQRTLQIVARGSDILLFLTGVYLGKGEMTTAFVLLGFRMANGYFCSHLVYKRLQAVIKEGGDK